MEDTKGEESVKVRGWRSALDVMSEEIRAIQLLIDYYSRHKEGNGRGKKVKVLLLSTSLLKSNPLLIKS